MIRGRPFVIQALAALLTFYAMVGVWLALTMAGSRDPRLHWVALLVGGVAFAISAGLAALTVWRREQRGPSMLMACAVVGATLCAAMPAAVRGAVHDRNTWIAAAGGGLLFAAFLVLAAHYVRLHLRSQT